MDGWMGGWMDGWRDGWVDGWMDRWMDGWVFQPCSSFETSDSGDGAVSLMSSESVGTHNGHSIITHYN